MKKCILCFLCLFCAVVFAFIALTLLVGRQEGHPKWWGAGVVICLKRGADLHTAQLMPLPLTVSCFSKIQIGFTFLVPAHPGSPGQMAVKWVYVCSCCSIFLLNGECVPFCVRFSFFHTKRRDWLGKRLQSDLFCVNSVSQSFPLFWTVFCHCDASGCLCTTGLAIQAAYTDLKH